MPYYSCHNFVRVASFNKNIKEIYMNIINVKTQSISRPIKSETFLFKRGELGELVFWGEDQYNEEMYKIKISLNNESTQHPHCILNLEKHYNGVKFYCEANSKNTFLSGEFTIGTPDDVKYDYEVRIYFQLNKNALFAVVHAIILKVPKE